MQIMQERLSAGVRKERKGLKIKTTGSTGYTGIRKSFRKYLKPEIAPQRVENEFI